MKLLLKDLGVRGYEGVLNDMKTFTKNGHQILPTKFGLCNIWQHTLSVVHLPRKIYSATTREYHSLEAIEVER